MAVFRFRLRQLSAVHIQVLSNTEWSSRRVSRSRRQPLGHIAQKTPRIGTDHVILSFLSETRQHTDDRRQQSATPRCDSGQNILRRFAILDRRPVNRNDLDQRYEDMEARKKFSVVSRNSRRLGPTGIAHIAQWLQFAR